MKYRKILLALSAAALCVAGLVLGAFWLQLRFGSGGFTRSIPLAEQLRRLDTVKTAESWLGAQEGGEKHGQILRIYNSHEPLAQGYAVTAEDNWCATYASAVAIQQNLTDIIPTECGCQRQIGLWKELARWEEDDNYMPLPGDYIYYAWDEKFSFGDCTGWVDHVGIVVGTAGPFIKVIEGNKDDTVTYRMIMRGDWQIRGYGLPDYGIK